MTKKCALYTRVSSRNQLDGDYNSLATQRERLEAYVKSQEGWEVYKVYEDGGFSAEGLNRPGLQSLLRDIAAGLIDCVLAYKVDRLTRSPKDFYTLTEFFEKHNVAFISVTQHFDTSSPMGRLLRNIMLDFAQFEREMTAERTRDKMQQRAEKGYWNGGYPPFGYRSENGKLFINPDEAGVVRIIFELFAATGSLAKVKQEFKLLGYKTRQGKDLGKTSIDNIIRNPIYAGKIQHRGRIYTGQHEAIVEESVFYRAQSVHRTQTHVSTRTKRSFLLKGLLKCAECGSVMTPHYTKKKTWVGHQLYFYYRCSRTMHHDKTICKIRQISADHIEDLVITDIGKLVSESPILVSAIEELNQGRDQQVDCYREELRKVKTRIRELDQEADQYVSALGKGKLSVGRLEKALEKVEALKAQLESRANELEDRIEEAEVQEFDHDLIRENLRRFKETFSTLTDEEKPECLQLILKDVVLSRDTVQLNIFDLPGFNYDGSQNRSDWLPGWDSNLSESIGRSGSGMRGSRDTPD